MEKQEALEQLEMIQEQQEKRMEYCLNLIRDGEELTPVENSNAKKSQSYSSYNEGWDDCIEEIKRRLRE